MNNIKNTNTAIKETKLGNTKFIVERHFGDLDLMDLYTDYVVNKIIEAEKHSPTSGNVA